MVAALNRIPYEQAAERRAALKQLLAAIGEGALVRPPFFCDFGDGIRIGARTFVNFNCTMLDGAPITLADGVWLGAGAIVCLGVSIGKSTVVGAGAVVARSLPAGVVAYGNPARVAREICDRDRLDPGESIIQL